ncbi:MAG: GGDEF domain-containing protein [Phycisphaeraceae bacterium]|nr:MAG: GGDEF domain-containing protein [Phycisphaeraceae bacterium]
MSRGHAARPTDEQHAGDPVRVVVVGRTVLDASWRDDASIEMVRARTPLEAVGEVAAPPASSRSRPTVVLVGRDGEPSDHAEAFLAAMREANPSVKLVRVGGNGWVEPSLYDAVLGEQVTPDSIREVLEARRFEPELLGRTVGLPEAKPAATSRAEPPLVVSKPVSMPAPEAEGTLPGDGSLLAALASDRAAFLHAALGLIRARTGATDLDFRSEADDPGHGVAVMSGRRRWGTLTSDRVGVGEVVPHAAWLGAWLAEHERQRTLRRAAFTDPLTGAWNRRYFDGFLDSAVRRARAARRTVTVLVFDIDGFKQYNDQFGHPAGDEILIETVKALKTSVRPSDRVCRIGGDEFAVIFDDPEGPRAVGSRPPESVYVLAKRVQRQIAERRFPKLGADAPGKLTISGGLAAFPWDGHDPETLLGKADELACQSKRQGKNAITLGPGAERVCRHPGDEC